MLMVPGMDSRIACVYPVLVPWWTLVVEGGSSGRVSVADHRSTITITKNRLK